MLAGISDRNRTYRVAQGVAAMAIHLVPEHATELAQLCSWRPGPDGVPLLDGCPSRFVGRILERVDFGDHTGMVLRGPAQVRPAKRIDPGHEA